MKYQGIIWIIALGFLASGCNKVEPERVFKVSTGQVTGITETACTAHGEVIELGTKTVTQHGFCLSRQTNPTIGSSEKMEQLGGTTSTGSFSAEISGLNPNTMYFVRAFLTNSDSTTYGASISFTTLEATVSSPSVVSVQAGSITQTSAVVGGNVTADGGADVTERGIFYGTSSDPQSSGAKVTVGSGTGTFTTLLSGLTSGLTYYFVAYAVNSSGLAIADNILNFTTLTESTAQKPSVTTTAAENVGQNTARVGGNVTDNGGASVTERGVFYGTSSNPQSSGTKISIGSGVGAYATDLTGLSSNTTYYFVAYAVNSQGMSVANNVLQFTTDQEPVITTPSVTTTAAVSVDQNSATIGGNVSDDGGASVTERGVYYGTQSNPESSGTKVDLGSGLGTFSTAVTGLAEGTTYYFVAYAINSEGTAYGSTLNFTTGQINPPGVSTNVAGSITETSAVVGGEVSDGGGGSVSDRGIYYGTSSDPGSSGTKLSRGSGLGSFTATLTGLTPGTRYYYVAYATNEAGTSLGSTLYFETVASSTSVTDIDGNVYQIVTIGDQTWMQENLRTTRYADGSTIPNVTGASTWGGLSSSAKAYCYYDNNSANANDYGALYTWAAAMNGASSTTASPSGIQGVCPSGWHMPSDEEWKELEMYLGMSRSDADNTSFRGTTEGGKLKETGYSRWQSPNTGATNSSGFTAPGSGYRLDDGDFGYIHYVATFWTASQSSSSDAYNRTLHYDGSQVYRNGFAKHRGFSVRCVKNE